MHGFVIAGTNSGCGKTTVTIGLMALLKKMGKKVAPFKVGPDYIDPLFHAHVLDSPSYNLDCYFLDDQQTRHLFYKHTSGKDVAIVEGVMGMYDGMGYEAKGSTHELSGILGLPVILVVNCKSLYQSVAAIVKGFAELKEDSRVKGVILNHVFGKEHYEFLKSIVERECQVKCIGYLPPNKEFGLESRHLGLVQAEEVVDLNKKVDVLAETMRGTIDIDALLALSAIDLEEVDIELPDISLKGLHLGVAHDKAFRFYYRDNLELIGQLGGTIHYFSPLEDESIHEMCNALYIGGGYPEVFAKDLSQNTSLMACIKDQAEKGMPIYAECGGLMYLTDSILSESGEKTTMCGVFNGSIRMTGRLNRFGYAEVTMNGVKGKCHEFHRSELVHAEEDNFTFQYHLEKPEKKKEWQCGLRRNNTLAAYAHVHFYANYGFTKQIFSLWKEAIM